MAHPRDPDEPLAGACSRPPSRERGTAVPPRRAGRGRRHPGGRPAGRRGGDRPPPPRGAGGLGGAPAGGRTSLAQAGGADPGAARRVRRVPPGGGGRRAPAPPGAPRTRRCRSRRRPAPPGRRRAGPGRHRHAPGRRRTGRPRCPRCRRPCRGTAPRSVASSARWRSSRGTVRATARPWPCTRSPSTPSPGRAAWGTPTVFEGARRPAGATSSILGGSVSTTLVAVAPVPGRARRRAFVSASLPIAVRRNIRNQFLSDFDLLAGPQPGVELRYVDARDEQEGPRPFPPPGAGASSRTAILRAPDGGILAAARAYAPDPRQAAARLASGYRRGLSAWPSSRSSRGRPARPGALLAAARCWPPRRIRAVLLVLGPPLPEPSLAAVCRPTPTPPRCWAAAGQPVDLLLTTAVLAPRRPRPPGLDARAGRRRAPSLVGGSPPATLLAVARGRDHVRRCGRHRGELLPRPRGHEPLVPGRVAHLRPAALPGPLAGHGAPGGGARSCWLGGTAPGVVARCSSGWAVLVGGASVCGARSSPRACPGRPASRPWSSWRWRRPSPGPGRTGSPRRAGPAPGCTAALVVAAWRALGLILYPSPLQASQRSLRLQIERNHAPLVLRQPQWREYVLAERPAADRLAQPAGGGAARASTARASRSWRSRSGRRPTWPRSASPRRWRSRTRPGP